MYFEFDSVVCLRVCFLLCLDLFSVGFWVVCFENGALGREEN